jgi:hypothetical protein
VEADVTLALATPALEPQFGEQNTALAVSVQAVPTADLGASEVNFEPTPRAYLSSAALAAAEPLRALQLDSEEHLTAIVPDTLAEDGDLSRYERRVRARFDDLARLDATVARWFRSLDEDDLAAMLRTGAVGQPLVAAIRKQKEWDDTLRGCVTHIFTELGPKAKGGMPMLAELAKDERASEDARVTALSAISAIGHDAAEASPLLNELRQGPSKRVREAAEWFDRETNS